MHLAGTSPCGGMPPVLPHAAVQAASAAALLRATPSSGVSSCEATSATSPAPHVALRVALPALVKMFLCQIRGWKRKKKEKKEKRKLKNVDMWALLVIVSSYFPESSSQTQDRNGPISLDQIRNGTVLSLKTDMGSSHSTLALNQTIPYCIHFV